MMFGVKPLDYSCRNFKHRLHLNSWSVYNLDVMGPIMITVDTLVTLAKEVENEDPIDWAMLAIDEDDAYKLIATSVLEKFNEPWNIDQQTALLATVTKLIVENMVLNLKLLEKNGKCS